MTIRALFLSAAVTACAVAGCGPKPAGKVLATTMAYEGSSKTWVPLIEYRAPDVDEITGIDPDEEKEPESTPEAIPAATPAAAPAAATPPVATPAVATPAKPAATPAKTPAAKPAPAPAAAKPAPTPAPKK